VVLDTAWAEEFREFCLQNPGPCPLLDETAPGSPEPRRLARGADIRYELPGYRIFANGTFTDASDLGAYWSDESVAFLLGCSFSFEQTLIANGVRMKHIDRSLTVSMYVTDIQCTPVGRLRGPMVVSMRPIPRERVRLVRSLCAQFSGAHGEPLDVDAPYDLGISALDRPDFGDVVPIGTDEVEMFWPCGVTPQVVLERSGCPSFACHRPGQMFVSDRADTIGVIVSAASDPGAP
jgi:uncharacterized protein YcsI (UPF0317 family)